MIISEKSKKFIDKLKSDKRFVNLTELMYQDIDKCKTDITNMVLQDRLYLEGSWSHYILDDINVIYEEDILRVNELLIMYGLRNYLPALKANDVSLIVNYRYNLYDGYGGIMDFVNIFHITIKGDDGDKDYMNTWFLLHDTDN